MKTGRKQKHFVTRNGKTIEGLSRMSDGRWRVIGSQLRFTEPDEQKAIARFHELTDDRGAAIERTVYSEVERMWDYVGQQIRTRPQWVAQRLGIEQIGYLTTLRPPEKLPSFSELEATWKTHFVKSIEQKRKVIAAWRD